MHNQPDRAVRRRRALWLVLVATLPLLGGCHRTPAGNSPPAESQADSVPVTVAVVYPERTAIHREVSQPGYIEAFEETPVFAKVSGYVNEGWKDRGDTLRKGEILATLWAPELVDDLKQKEALVEQAEVAITQARELVTVAEKGYNSAVEQIKVAEANCQMQLARQKRTHSQAQRLERMTSTVMERENIEEAQLGYETAKAGVMEAEAKITAAKAMRDEAKARWNKTVADLRAAEVNRKVAEKNRDLAKDFVNYMRLPAPYDCVVYQRNINTGDFVHAATGGAGKPLYVVHRRDKMRIFVQVPETDADWVQKGAEARLRVRGLVGQTFTGSVARISWSLDPATRTLRAEIDLPNSEGRLRPGMYAHATLSADLPDRLTLPRSSVVTEGDAIRGYQSYCYQVVDGKVRRLLIELGAGDSQRIEVLRKQASSGGPWEPFTGDEAIVRGELSVLKDGQGVQVKQQGN
jgi:RND family efflux transporter MFP subunit